MQRALRALVLVAVVGMFFAPFLVSAQATTTPGKSLPYWGPILSCTGNNPAISGVTTTLPRCSSVCDILSTGQNVLYFGVSLALFALAPFFFIWGAVQMIVSGGNSEKFSEGKKVITSAVVAVLFVLLSYVIVNTFFFAVSRVFNSNLQQELGGSWSTIRCTPPATQ